MAVLLTERSLGHVDNYSVITVVEQSLFWLSFFFISVNLSASFDIKSSCLLPLIYLFLHNSLGHTLFHSLIQSTWRMCRFLIQSLKFVLTLWRLLGGSFLFFSGELVGLWFGLVIFNKRSCIWVLLDLKSLPVCSNKSFPLVRYFELCFVMEFLYTWVKSIHNYTGHKAGFYVLVSWLTSGVGELRHGSLLKYQRLYLIP